MNLSKIAQTAARIFAPQLTVFSKLSPVDTRTALSNIQGNVRALAHPQTRSLWVKPITNKVTSPYRAVKREFDTIRNAAIPEFRNLYRPTKEESYNALKMQAKYGITQPLINTGSAFPNTTEAVSGASYRLMSNIPGTLRDTNRVANSVLRLGNQLLGLPTPSKDATSTKFAKATRVLFESPEEAKLIRQKMYKGEDLTPQEIDFAKSQTIDLIANIMPNAPEATKNVISEARSGFTKLADNLNLGRATQADRKWIERIDPTNTDPDKVVREVKKFTNTAKNKVNFLDYFRTPTKVLEKLGMQDEAKLLEKKYLEYQIELPKEIDKISNWYNQVKDIPGSSKRIFRYLDGNQTEPLTEAEEKVAKEIRAYYRQWANKLGLPKDKRITDYVTHIFEDQLIKKDFDEDLAKLIRGQVPGSVYDPFLQKREGVTGYIEDVFQALQAYTKRATRKYYVDQALGLIKEKAKNLDTLSYNFLEKYTSQINMRPSDLDTLLDNFIKSTPIEYRLGARPVNRITKEVSKNVYAAALGFNPKSAITNLTQNINTFAELGFEDTATGFMKATRELLQGSDELERVGVLTDNFVQNKPLNAFNRIRDKVFNASFVLFDAVEKFNRAVAYYGGKERALKAGLSETEAIEAGLELAKKTQFTYGPVNTPLVLGSDIAKSIGQFSTYALKQSEFVGEMISNKEWGKLTRYLGAYVALIWSFGEVLGTDYSDLFPAGKFFTGQSKLGNTSPYRFVYSVMDAVKKASGTRPTDNYGNELSWNDIARTGLDTLGGSFIPGYVQAKRSYQGIQAYNRGYSESKTGRVRYPIEHTPSEFIKSAIFGQYTTKNAREYFDEEQTPLGTKQTQVYKSLSPTDREIYLQTIRDKNALKNRVTSIDSISGDERIREVQKSLVAEKLDNLLPTTQDELDLYYLYDYLHLPTKNKYDQEVKQSEGYSLASRVYQDERLTSDQRQYLLSRLGVTEPEIAYYSASGDSVAERTSAILSQIQSANPTHDELMAFLVRGRKEVNGKVYASEGVLQNLADEGLITYSEASQINKIKLDSQGQKLNKPKKPKKPKYKKVSPIKVKAVKIRRVRPKKVKKMKTYRLNSIK